jgi:hypothetical protein
MIRIDYNPDPNPESLDQTGSGYKLKQNFGDIFFFKFLKIKIKKRETIFGKKNLVVCTISYLLLAKCKLVLQVVPVYFC